MTRRVLDALRSQGVRDFGRDCTVLAGLAVAGYGIWMVNHAAAVIYAGALVAALAFLSAPKEPDGSGE